MFKKWHSWTESFSEVKSLPTKDLHVALYLVNLIQNGESLAVIKNTFYAIKFFHNLGNWKDPCESSLCTNILEAVKRISSKTTIEARLTYTETEINCILLRQDRIFAQYRY